MALNASAPRAPVHRWEPVVCTDPTGHVLGILRIEDLIAAARRAADPHQTPVQHGGRCTN